MLQNSLYSTIGQEWNPFFFDKESSTILYNTVQGLEILKCVKQYFVVEIFDEISWIMCIPISIPIIYNI